MFFRRQEGQYRETDRVTRYKLVKSGKHWLRASTSLFGLFKVFRGSVDTTQVMTEVIENQTNNTITGLDIIRGLAATGAVLGGAVATQTTVHANDAVALEKTLESSDVLATNDSVVLGSVSKANPEESTSLSHSESESVSSSESTSTSQSVSASTSASMSASTSASVSASTSASASVSASTSVSSSQLMLHSEDSSVATSTASVETAGQFESASAENQVVSQGLPNSNLSAPVLDSAKSATGLTEKTSELTSLAGVTAGALSSVEVSTKKNEEDRKKLAKISAEMGEYLAKAADLPDTSAAILKVEAAITEIESALQDPAADLGSVVKTATSARNSIANAVLRATSGQRDGRNGQAIERGSSPRASFSSRGSDRSAAGQSRAASQKPSISLPNAVTYFNDDSISEINMPMSDDKGMVRLDPGPKNTIITGLAAPNYPATSRNGYGDLAAYDKYGKFTGYQTSYNVKIVGTIGRNNGIGNPGRADGAWEPYKPGAHIIQYIVTDTDGLTAKAEMTLNIRGFNERNEPVRGATVTVNDKEHLSQTEKEQVLANFRTANASILSSTDYKKGTEEGSLSVADNGVVTITYRDRTTDTVDSNLTYGVEKATDTFYAVSNESLSNINPRSLVRPVGGASDLPNGTTFAWKQAPTMEVGSRAATLTVTHPDRTTTDLTYNYTVYPKIETKTNNGVTGQFYAFKAVPGSDVTVAKSYANNIGGFSNLYLNNDSLPSGSTFSYEYRLNNKASAQVSRQDGSPAFSAVWHTTGANPVSHRTTYTVRATYPKGRLGDVTTSNPALTSTVTFDYTVVDPVAKQEYTTKVGDTTPLNDIIANPGNALKNSDSSVAIPTGTTYEWVSRPDASTSGIFKKEVKVTLPQGSTTQSRNATNVPVVIKVRPNPPQISAVQVTNTGGLPDKGITVTDVVPGATVTLTIGGKTLTKTAGANVTSLTFTPAEVADSNGLLPTGNVTVKQSKVFTNPVTNANETLESDVSTVAITPETEKPQVIDTVVKVKNDANTWSDAPKTSENGTPVYTFYSGDSLEFTAKFKDNSGVIQNTEVRNGGSGKPTVSLLFNNTWGTETVNKVTTKTTATDNQPATTTATAEINPDLSYAPGNTITRSINAEDFSGNRSDGTTFGLKQGELKDRLGEETVPPITVRDIANLTENDRNSIKAAVEKAYPQNKHRIRTYTQQSNGNVLITYKDGTTRTVTPNLEQNYQTKSDRFYAVAGENANSLTARNFIKSADGTELPANTRVVWKNGAPDLSTPGDKTATLTVTDSKGISKDITYKYTVHQKIETNTKDGVTGQFYGFKGGTNDRTASGSWSNNIGGYTNLYTNVRDLPANTTWAYEYKLNSTLNGPGALQKTQSGGKPEFSSVWNNTQAHQTEYRVVATYPTGRFGTPSTQDPALKSETSFTYTVVDPVAKQTYETTAGNMSPLTTISTTPGEAITNTANTPAIPSGTSYEWETPLNEAAISTPGYITRKVKVTLPQGSTDTARNSTLVPVTIKINLKTPQIADDQVKQQGGLPERSITVTNVSPGATVTLRINNRTFEKVATGDTVRKRS